MYIQTHSGQLLQTGVLEQRAFGGLTHRRDFSSTRSPICLSAAGSSSRQRRTVPAVVRIVGLRDPEAAHNGKRLQLSSGGSLAASRSMSRTHSIKLPKLTPAWQALAVLDALAVPWGLKQLSMAFMASHMLGVSPPAEYYVLNWAIAVLCNLYDQYKGQGSVADMINVPIRMSLIQQYQGAIQAHLAISLGLVAGSLALLPSAVLQSFLPGILATSAYWLPILPNGTTAKQLPAAKNLFAAGVETFALVKFALAAVPAAAADSISTTTVAATAVFFVAVNMALAVLADVRDLEGDRVAGTRSILVIFGVPAAVNVAVSCCVVACFAATAAMPHMWPASVSALLVLAAGWAFRDMQNSSTNSSSARSSNARGPRLDTLSQTFVSWLHALVGCVGCIALYWF